MAIAQTSWSSPLLQDLWAERTATRSALEDEVRGLTDGQLAFRPAAHRWSIGEILDHLCLSERSITRAVSRLFQQAAGLGQIWIAMDGDQFDAAIDHALYARPATAPESVHPSPERPLQLLLGDLVESRERFEEVARQVDGKAVGLVRLPHFQLGPLNLFQWLAVEGAHEAKHLAAVRRIKADPHFPGVRSA
jgi:hypothetical protein